MTGGTFGSRPCAAIAKRLAIVASISAAGLHMLAVIFSVDRQRIVPWSFAATTVVDARTKTDLGVN